MRWLKHITVAHDDPAVCVILERMGPEGYGIYWLMLEHIAMGIEKSSDAIPTRTHAAVEWAKICHCSARKLRDFCEIATGLRLICASSAPELRQFGSRRVADRLQIDAPKLLKYRDEYSKKSGQTPEQDRETHTDGEQKEIQTKSGDALRAETPTVSPKVTAIKPIDEVAIWFEAEFWPLYPRKVAKPAALKAIRRHASTPEARAQILAGLRAHAPALRVKDPEFVPFPSTWINQQRWLDPPESMRNKSALLPFQPREGIAEQMTRVVRERIERGERPI